jgi:uncharacterized protein (TIGR02145 family)
MKKFLQASSFSLTLVFASCSQNDSSNGSSHNSIIDTCGGKEYDTMLYDCVKGEIVGSCRGQNYYTEYEYCENGEIKDLLSSSSNVRPSSSSSTTMSSSNIASSSSQQQSSSSTVLGGCDPSTQGSTATCGPGYDLSSSSEHGSSSSINSSNTIQNSGTFIDKKKKKNYRWIKIGEQIWMAENLNYVVEGSRCYKDILYPDEAANCATYGRLYNWSTAMVFLSLCNESSTNASCSVSSKHRGICPSGWHIPSYDEWSTLTNYVEKEKSCTYCAGFYLKATSSWNINPYDGSGNGSDNYGFSALPGGFGYSGSGSTNAGTTGYWRSATASTGYEAAVLSIEYNLDSMRNGSHSKTELHSVRCVKD